jgi:hypothetical protein
MASFDVRVRDLANRANLTVGSLTGSRARLGFRCRRNSQTLWIQPFSDGIWEFSCVSAISYYRPTDFPQSMLAMALVQNSKNKRGFWCLEQIRDTYALEYMQNFPEYLLTPEEFSRICWIVVENVDNLESAIFG